jgi:aldehyde dehydrogenase (NAD+)
MDPELIYVGGEWRASRGSRWIEVVNPATEEAIARVPDGAPSDVDDAVTQARTAFAGWSASSPEERAWYLTGLRRELMARRDEFAATITTEMGAPVAFARRVQTGLPLLALGAYLDALPASVEPERIGHSVVLREPVGVVAAITPWNYPLGQVVAKVAAALAAGCTVVLKPSEVAPLSAALLVDVLHRLRLPPGVLNLVSGTGPVVGEALASHPDVDMVSFTGSTAAGRRVAALAADTVKKVVLELGGKSANVLLPDADLDTAVPAGVASCMMNAGQTCTALTRMLVPRSRYEEVLARAAAAAGEYRPGDPTDPRTRLGPLVSAGRREQVLGYVEKGLAEGARAVTAVPDNAHLPERGYFVFPTVFGVEDPGATVAQEEIFGPVLCVIPYGEEDEAVAIANNSIYGLSGAVWSADTDRAVAFARRMRTGRVDINGATLNPAAPFGGRRQSGVGREMGRYGLAEFQEVKSVQLPIG